MTKATIVLTFLALVVCVSNVKASPAIALGYNPVEVCLENCAQCKKMLGQWFEGPLCAEYCIEYRSKLIPDCEDFASISPFLNKL